MIDCPTTSAVRDAGADDDPAALLDALLAPGSLATLLAPDAGPLPLAIVRRAAGEPAAAVLRRPGRRLRARLVALGWELAGGSGPPPPALAGLVELLHAGSLVIDDIEDGSTHRRGAPALHTQCGLPLALNTGNLLYFLPLTLLDALALPPARALAVHRAIARTMVRSHCGQAIDLAVQVTALAPADVPAVVVALSGLKTGSLLALAASLGALTRGAAEPQTAALARFGHAFGVALQMHDDLANLDPAHDARKFGEDLRLGRATWVWAWLAARLDAPAFAALQQQVAAVQAGRADAAALADHLRDALGDHGRRHAVAHLRAARRALRRALGPAPALLALARLCARLEHAHG